MVVYAKPEVTFTGKLAVIPRWLGWLVLLGVVSIPVAKYLVERRSKGG